MEYSDFQNPTITNLEKIAKSFKEAQSEPVLNQTTPENNIIYDIGFGIKTLSKICEKFEDDYIEFLKLFNLNSNEIEFSQENQLLKNSSLIKFAIRLTSILIDFFENGLENKEKTFAINLIKKINDHLMSLI